MNQLRPLSLLISAVLVVLTGCGKSPVTTSESTAKELRFPVTTSVVAATDITATITAPASIEADELLTITARVAGVAERVAFQVGDAVNPDQVLVTIEPERFRLAVAQARAGLTKAEANKADNDAALKRREDANRATPGLVRDEDIQSFRTKVLAAAAEVDQAHTALAKAELDLNDALVRAPSVGVIQSRGVQTGQYVQPGMALATLVRRDPMQVVFSIPESDAARLTIGSVISWELPGQEVTGKATVHFIAAAADRNSRLVEIRGRLANDAPNSVRPGAFARVSLALTKRSALVVPFTAVRISERGHLMYVVDGERAKERKVTTGSNLGDGRVEIIAGLQAGEHLIVVGADTVGNNNLITEIPLTIEPDRAKL